MKYVSISIENFRSFKNKQTFYFGDGAGFNFLRGDNRVEPELEGNASGKSTIWEALCWVQFGKTSRGLKASDIGTWSVGKNTSVEVVFELDGVENAIRRTWNPNSLKRSRGEIDFEDITQDELEDLIGYTFTPFLHSIFVSQFTPMFLDLGPTEKANLISEVLDLDKWIEFSAKAGEAAKSAEKRIVTMQSSFDRLVGRLDEVERIDYSKDFDAWEESAASRKDELMAQFEEVCEERKKIKEASESSKSRLVELRDMKRTESSALVTAQNRVNGFKQQEGSKLTEKSKAEATLEFTEGQYKYLQDNEFCPACLQVIGDRHRRDEIARFKGVIESLKIDVARLHKEHSDLHDRRSSSEDDCIVHRETLAELNNQIARIEGDEISAGSKLHSLDTSLDRIESQIDGISGEVNPYDARIAEVQATRDEIYAEASLLVEEIESVHRTQAINSYWIKGFKDLRLFLISEALVQLEIEVNNALVQLGLVGWKIEFSVDAETKSGTVRRGFTAYIKSPYNTTLVPWEAWSGGESQRLRIAATLGLSNLILNSLGVDTNLEIWDEPSTWMTESGITDLLETLQERSRIQGKQIWVVDHRLLEFGGFSKVVTVVKEESGSIIQQ